MKFSDQIEALRARMVDEHAEAMRLIEGLDKRLLANDGEVMRALESMLIADAQRKADIVAALQTLAARIGFLPHVPAHPLDARRPPALERMPDSLDRFQRAPGVRAVA